MAGLNGAGTDDGPKPGLAAGGGLLSPLSRAQYAALAVMRWRVFVNGLRSKRGAFEMGARTVSFVVYALMGLGIGAAQSGFAYWLASDGKWPYFPILFWVTCVMWQVVPIMLASFQEQFDLGSLLRFPVGFRSFFLLYVVFGLSDVSTILGGLCCLGILIGVTVARPDLFAWTALILAVFAAFNILLVRAVFAWIDRWLAQRKTREILGALFMVLILSVQLINPALHQTRRHGQTQKQQKVEMYRNLMASPWFKTANEVQGWLPPGLTGIALQRAAVRQSAEPALEPLGMLGLFVLAAGSVLGLRLRSEFRGENLGAAPARTKAAASHGKATGGRDMVAKRAGVSGVENRLKGSGPVAAIVEKEMRSLLRTLPLLYAVGAPLVLVLVISGGFLRGSPHMAAAITVSPWAFALCVFFAQIGFRQLFSNNLGAEGAGIQLYFLSPTPMRTVLLAKNLFHAALFAVALVIAGLLAAMRLGAPDGVVVAGTVAWFLFVLPSSLAVGNIFSLTMPYRINPGRISRQRGSQASTLLSLLLQGAMLGVGAVVYAVCSLGGMLWLTIPIFLVLAAIAVFVWLRILGNADEIASQRKDLLIATLVKAE